MALHALMERDAATDQLFASPALAAPARPRTEVRPGNPNGDPNDLSALRVQLALVCAEALAKSVQHFGGGELWLIGSLPSCAPQADAVEVQARARLGNSGLGTVAVEELARALKDTGDLRTSARGARQAAQLSWLMRQEPNGEAVLPLVRGVGECAQAVLQAGADALAAGGDYTTLMNAALLFRSVDDARRAGERKLGPDALGLRDLLSPGGRRMARSAMWFFSVAAEGMARVCAREASALPAAPGSDNAGITPLA